MSTHIDQTVYLRWYEFTGNHIQELQYILPSVTSPEGQEKSPKRSCWSSVLFFSLPSRPKQKLDRSGISKWPSESRCGAPLGRTWLLTAVRSGKDALGTTLRSLPLERDSSNSQELAWCWDGAIHTSELGTAPS